MGLHGLHRRCCVVGMNAGGYGLFGDEMRLGRDVIACVASEISAFYTPGKEELTATPPSSTSKSNPLEACLVTPVDTVIRGDT